MTDPFKRVFDSAIGLDIADDRVRVVVLKKRFKAVRIHKHSEEPIGSSPDQNAEIVRSVRTLFARLKIPQKEVVIRVGGKGVRHEILEAPPFPPEELGIRVRESLRKRFPSWNGPVHSELRISHHVIERNGKGCRLLTAYCQTETLDKAVEPVLNAGLIPEIISACGFGLLLSFAFEEEGFFDRRVAIAENCGGRIRMVLSESGSPADYIEIETETDPSNPALDSSREARKRMSEVFAQWRSGPKDLDRVLLSGFDTKSALIRADVPDTVPIREVHALTGTAGRKPALPAGYGLAAGLALKKLFPFLNSLDFASADLKRTAGRAREKRLGLRFLLTGGAAVLACMILLATVKHVALSRLEASEAEAASLNAPIAGMERLQTSIAVLSRGLKHMRGLANRKSNVAELMREIGVRIPESVMLEKLALQPDVNSAADKKAQPKKQARIDGWAPDETEIAAFIGRLEESPLFSKVELVTTERAGEEDGAGKRKRRNAPPVRFILTANLEGRPRAGGLKQDQARIEQTEEQDHDQ